MKAVSKVSSEINPIPYAAFNMSRTSVSVTHITEAPAAGYVSPVS